MIKNYCMKKIKNLNNPNKHSLSTSCMPSIALDVLTSPCNRGTRNITAQRGGCCFSNKDPEFPLGGRLFTQWHFQTSTVGQLLSQVLGMQQGMKQGLYLLGSCRAQVRDKPTTLL